MSRKDIWIVVLLVGGYVVCQAIADIGATKFISLAGVVIPAGTFIFTITFTLRDMLHKRLGKEWARAAIVSAGLFNILMAAYLQAMASLPAPPFFKLNEAWSAIFGIVPAIVIGSILAEVISELIDTEVYHFWRHRFANLPQWTRVLVSNAISLPIDSLIFALTAFVLLPPLFGGEALPFMVALSLVGGQIIWKGLITAVSLPSIYLVTERSLSVRLETGLVE